MQSNPTENRHKGPTLDESSIQSKDNSNKLSAIWALNTYNSQIGISSLSTSVAHYIPVNYHTTPLSFESHLSDLLLTPVLFVKHF